MQSALCRGPTSNRSATQPVSLIPVISQELTFVIGWSNHKVKKKEKKILGDFMFQQDEIAGEEVSNKI